MGKSGGFLEIKRKEKSFQLKFKWLQLFQERAGMVLVSTSFLRNRITLTVRTKTFETKEVN